jgi:hypothetical protein
MSDIMSTAERMAVAVLKGDYDAARMLATLLIDEYQEGAMFLPHVQRLKVSVDRVRCILYARNEPDIEIDSQDRLNAVFREWLSGERPVLGLVGVKRVELYDLPEPKVPVVYATSRKKRR